MPSARRLCSSRAPHVLRGSRLTIRAEVLPDDPEWHIGRMPTLIHTMPFRRPGTGGRSAGRSGGRHADRDEPRHDQGSGSWPAGDREPATRADPAPLRRHRPRRDLEDLRSRSACSRATSHQSQPRGIIANGSAWSSVTASFGTEDFRRLLDRRQRRPRHEELPLRRPVRQRGLDGRHRRRLRLPEQRRDELQLRLDLPGRGLAAADAAGGRPGGPSATKPQERNRYRVVDSLFAGNRRLAGSGTGARLEYQDIDPSFLELVGTQVSTSRWPWSVTRRSGIPAPSDRIRGGEDRSRLFTKPLA